MKNMYKTMFFNKTPEIMTQRNKYFNILFVLSHLFQKNHLNLYLPPTMYENYDIYNLSTFFVW